MQAFGGPTTAHSYGAPGVNTFFVDKDLARRKGAGRVFYLDAVRQTKPKLASSLDYFLWLGCLKPHKWNVAVPQQLKYDSAG